MIEIGQLLVNQENKYSKVYYQVTNIIDDIVYYDYVRFYSGPTTYSIYGEGKNKLERVQTFTQTKFVSLSQAMNEQFFKLLDKGE